MSAFIYQKDNFAAGVRCAVGQSDFATLLMRMDISQVLTIGVSFYGKQIALCHAWRFAS